MDDHKSLKYTGWHLRCLRQRWHTHLGPHNVRRIVDEKVDGQTRFVQRRATGEPQALELFRGINYGLAEGKNTERGARERRNVKSRFALFNKTYVMTRVVAPVLFLRVVRLTKN